MTDAALLRVIIGLVLVVATILSCAWLARRSGLLTRGTGGVLKSVATMALGPRNQINVVQIEQTWLVVGVSGTQMTLLHTLPAPAGADPGAAQAVLPATPGSAFGATGAAAPGVTTPGATFAERLARALKRPS